MRRVTVIICTNRVPAGAARCLASLADEGADEVLVVDNVSPDPEGLARVAARHGAQLVAEPVLGISAARNRGLQVATGDVVVYLDDDVAVRPGLVAAHRAAYDHPGVAIAGGPVLLDLAGMARPRWLSEAVEGFVSVLDLGPVARAVEPHEWLNGANISFDRDAAVAAGGFDQRIGRRGADDVTAGEETMLLAVLKQGGATAWWTPDPVVDHRFQPERLTRRWLLRRAWGQGAIDVAIEADGDRLHGLSASTLAWRGVSPLGATPRWAAPSGWPTAELARRLRLLGAAQALRR